MSDEALIATYRAHLQTHRGIALDDVREDSDGTIRFGLEVAEPADLRALAGYDLGATIGQGAMGQVVQARQTSLGRDVAVKVLRNVADGPGGEHLAREARVTGGLEHPNIVPVHDLGLTSDGDPMIVMKRIDGQAWSQWLAQPTEGQQAAIDEAGGTLAFHLDVLAKVCRAVSYAHSRGVLHRDLKPDNVMIGHFGEVYLLDWGIALELSEASRGDKTLCGTPAYMAPEMAGGQPLDERSDQYQLGVILFEICAGRRMRERAAIPITLARAFRGEIPDLPKTVPKALRAICRRALAKEPDDRFGSVDALRLAIRDFLRRRAWMELAESAVSRAQEAIREVRSPDAETQGAVADASEVRVALEQLLAREDDGALRSARTELISALLDRELDHGRLVLCEQHLESLGADATEEQRRRVAELAERKKAEAAELEELRAAYDRRFGSQARRRTTAVVAVAASAMWTGVGVTERFFLGHPLDFLDVWWAPLVIVGLGVGGLLSAPRPPAGAPSQGVLQHRAAVLSMLLMAGAVPVLVLADLPFAKAIGLCYVLVIGPGLLHQAVLSNPRLWPVAVGLVLAGAAFLASPEGLRWFVLAGAHVFLLPLGLHADRDWESGQGGER